MQTLAGFFFFRALQARCRQIRQIEARTSQLLPLFRDAEKTR